MTPEEEIKLLRDLLRRWFDEYGYSTMRGRPVDSALDAETERVLENAKDGGT